MTTTHRYNPITSAEMQRLVLNLVDEGLMEPVTLENGVSGYQMTEKGREQAKPIVVTEYRLTPKGREALGEMKRWH
jgi:DNA-binding PadR family transcriptional regulator